MGSDQGLTKEVVVKTLEYATLEHQRPEVARTGAVGLAVAGGFGGFVGICLDPPPWGLWWMGLLIAAGGVLVAALRKWRRRVHVGAVVMGWVVVGLAMMFAGLFVVGLIGMGVGLLRP